MERLVVHESFSVNIRFSRALSIFSGHEMNDKCDSSCMIAWHEYTIMPPYEHKLAANYRACTLHETNMASCKPLESLESGNIAWDLRPRRSQHDLKHSAVLQQRNDQINNHSWPLLFQSRTKQTRQKCLHNWRSHPLALHCQQYSPDFQLLHRQAQLNPLAANSRPRERKVHVFFQSPARHSQTYCVGTLGILHKLLLRREINTDFSFSSSSYSQSQPSTKVR